MRTSPFVVLVSAIAALVPAAFAQQLEFLPDATPQKPEQVKYTLLKPADKTSELVKQGERNPFAKSDDELRTQNQKGTNEENQIRERLEKLRVVGVSPGLRGLRVMLGDMVLEPGQLVPQVLQEQSVSLRVGNITAQAIELVWLEKKPSGLPPRTLTIAVDLRPYVRYQLMGQPTEKNQWEKQKDEATKTPVARLFPEVSQTAASGAQQVAQNTAVPRALPVDDTPPATEGTPEEEKPEIKPNPQWTKAMGLLEKLLPKGEAKP